MGDKIVVKALNAAKAQGRRCLCALLLLRYDFFVCFGVSNCDCDKKGTASHICFLQQKTLATVCINCIINESECQRTVCYSWSFDKILNHSPIIHSLSHPNSSAMSLARGSDMVSSFFISCKPVDIILADTNSFCKLSFCQHLFGDYFIESVGKCHLYFPSFLACFIRVANSNNCLREDIPSFE